MFETHVQYMILIFLQMDYMLFGCFRYYSNDFFLFSIIPALLFYLYQIYSVNTGLVIILLLEFQAVF